MSTINDSSLQCARLRIDQNVPSIDFNLYNTSQIILFIIINQSLSSVNIIVNFNQASDFSSSINEIRIGLLVAHSSFTINNQTTPIYSSYQIPILNWKKSQPDTYDLIDLLTIRSDEYKTDTSLCQWNAALWNSLFIGNSTSELPYAYILKTTNTNLIFTLADVENISTPSLYLNILYCIPYQFGTTELALTITFGLLFVLIFVALSILHYLKTADDTSRYFQHKIRHISSINPRPSASSIQYVD